MFEAPQPPPSRPPSLNTPPIPPPVPQTPVQYFSHPQETQGEAVFVDLTPLTQVQAGQGTFAELQAVDATLTEAEATFTEAPVTEATFTEALVTEATFTEGPGTEETFTEVPVANRTFTEVPGTEATFTELPVASGTFAEVPGIEAAFTEMVAAEHTFSGMEAAEGTFSQLQGAGPTFPQVPLAQDAFPEQYGTLQLGEVTPYSEVTAPPSLCGVPLTEVSLAEDEGVPDASAEVEVLTSEDTPQYTALTPAVPAPMPTPMDTLTSPVVVEVAGPGLRLAIPNAFMSSQQHEHAHTPPPTPTPPERPPDHSDVLSALRASIFRSRARKRAAPAEETEEKKEKKKRRPAHSPPTPPPPVDTGEGGQGKSSPHPAAPGGGGRGAGAAGVPRVPHVCFQCAYAFGVTGGSAACDASIRCLSFREERQEMFLLLSLSLSLTLTHSLTRSHLYSFCFSRICCVDGPIMLSEEVKGPYLDGLPSLEPTVSSKDVKESTKDEVRQDYMKKAVSEWTTDDVVDFLMGTHTHADYDFSIINTMNGAQLMRQSREFFLRFSPEYGEDLYNEVQRRVLERATSITSTPYQVSLSSTTTTSPLQRPFLLTAPPHTLRHLSPQPSVICDAQAPYELVIDPQAQLRFAPDPRDPSVYEQTHRGAMKIVPPPLVALERREERQVTGDRGVGAGSSGEQVQGVKEEVKIEPPKKRGPGRPKKPESELKKKKKKTGRLWEFIRNLLLNPETCPSMVKWENPEEGLFRFIDGEKVAKRWGERKGNKEMNYEKLSRAMRYYYKTQIFEAVIGRRLVYKFGKKASGWRTSNPNFANPPENPSLEEPTPAAAPPPPPPHHHHYDQLHSDLKPKTSQGDLVLSPPQHHHYEQLHTDLKQKTSQGDLVLSPPQHHHYEQLHTDLKQKTSQGDLVLSPPQHHLHHYTTQLLLPELKAPPPPAHHYKENFLSSPHAQDTKSHLTHPLSLTMHHTPHHHHHHHHT
ncbi:uncharacterized protein LOC123516926 [Portunus trituberculatus]|uniref:uncharacterized protein LOC123516926 n=1 Tax=Portunus trituberculatus TaxID=210409 RepID=UPI001E1CB37A|nr:uncharacterized protein LOC123516926 [Portunus trituberculatus]